MPLTQVLMWHTLCEVRVTEGSSYRESTVYAIRRLFNYLHIPCLFFECLFYFLSCINLQNLLITVNIKTYGFFFFFWSGEGDRFRFFSFPIKRS